MENKIELGVGPNGFPERCPASKHYNNPWISKISLQLYFQNNRKALKNTNF